MVFQDLTLVSYRQDFMEAVKTVLVRDLYPFPNRRSDPFESDVDWLNEISISIPGPILN